MTVFEIICSFTLREFYVEDYIVCHLLHLTQNILTTVKIQRKGPAPTGATSSSYADLCSG